MGFWYSKNTKLLFRCAVNSWYRTSGTYYGYAYNGENFIDTAGNTGMYLYNQSSDSSSSLATTNARAYAYYMMRVPVDPSPSTTHVCLDNGVFDDTKYDYLGEISGLTLAASSSFPGSTIINVTNSTTQSVTFNAIEWTTTRYLSNSTTSQGTSATFLVAAYICDSPVTLAAGQTYSLEFTV